MMRAPLVSGFLSASILFAFTGGAGAQADEVREAPALEGSTQALLLRVEVVLETHDPGVDRDAILAATNAVQSDARGRARTVLHVVLPIDGDARVSVYSGDASPEHFVIARGEEISWLQRALVDEVRRRLVQVHPEAGALLLTWDGHERIDAPALLFEWRLRESAANLATPPRR